MKLTVRTLLVVWLAAWTATMGIAGEVGYRLEVAGLACPFCVYGIEKKLKALEDVERVDTHIKESVVIVTMANGATLDEATARKAVEDAGFTLEGFGRAPEDASQ